MTPAFLRVNTLYIHVRLKLWRDHFRNNRTDLLPRDLQGQTPTDKKHHYINIFIKILDDSICIIDKSHTERVNAYVKTVYFQISDITLYNRKPIPMLLKGHKLGRLP